MERSITITESLWIQTNTIVLKPGWWRRALVPLLRMQMRSATRKAMAAAKQTLEQHVS